MPKHTKAERAKRTKNKIAKGGRTPKAGGKRLQKKIATGRKKS